CASGGDLSRSNSLFKLVFLKEPNVGKTSLITRVIYSSFDNTFQETIDVDFLSKTMFFEFTITQMLTHSSKLQNGLMSEPEEMMLSSR
uniref:Ras-related GTP-binding protein n=1 Tax=Marmota marmota marmota TaxID=9994 RepID=A0A8C5ZX17_MARMA